MANEPASVGILPVTLNHTEHPTPTVPVQSHVHPLAAQADTQSWKFGSLKTEVDLRGGGCASSLLCDTAPEEDQNGFVSKELDISSKSTETASGQQEDEDLAATRNERPTSPVWSGWAELENDPEIFTILLQEWGVPNLHVQEIIDIAELITAQHDETLGLIFLSRYVAPETDSTATIKNLSENISTPWFANQISKFSCGTVALMNILMNSQNTSLSETLSNFKTSTSTYSAKDRGIALDENAKFREIHNSFSTKMDRMVVDVLLKEDAQKFKARKQTEARQVKQAEKGEKSQKRKRGGIGPKKRKKKSAVADEEDNGFHFVAYVPANGAVWEMDGLQAQPGCLGRIAVDQTWLNVAAEDLMTKMQEALDSGQDCSLMSISKTHLPVAVMSEAERSRKQEDWAPFIEHMLRLHAEKGDLQELLGL